MDCHVSLLARIDIPPPEPAVVCCSGGLDSSALCLYLCRRGWDLQPVFLDYGQRAVAMEWAALGDVVDAMGMPQPVRLSVDGLKQARALTQQGVGGYPLRNLWIATLASSYGALVGRRATFMGLVEAAEELTYPDARAEPFDALAHIVNAVGGLTLMAPFVSSTKYAVVHYAFTRGLPLDLTYSCYVGARNHCGECDGCHERNSVLRLFQ